MTALKNTLAVLALLIVIALTVLFVSAQNSSNAAPLESAPLDAVAARQAMVQFHTEMIDIECAGVEENPAAAPAYCTNAVIQQVEIESRVNEG